MELKMGITSFINDQIDRVKQDGNTNEMSTTMNIS